MAKSSWDWPQEYKMDHVWRGDAYIFNQETFTAEESPGERLNPRSGTNEDQTNLTERFQDLGFNVKPYYNSEKKLMLDTLRKAAEANYKDADCFVCVILSHGKEDHIYAYDEQVKINEITDLFRGNNCKSLVGKPKIFIFQACAGKEKDFAVTGMSGGSCEREPSPFYTLPTEADFLMCYSTVKGFKSFRDTSLGGLYIQDLCEALKEYGSTLEFTELLTLVSLKVAERNPTSCWKQMPCFTSMLTKKLYFKPKQ